MIVRQIPEGFLFTTPGSGNMFIRGRESEVGEFDVLRTFDGKNYDWLGNMLAKPVLEADLYWGNICVARLFGGHIRVMLETLKIPLTNYNPLHPSANLAFLLGHEGLWFHSGKGKIHRLTYPIYSYSALDKRQCLEVELLAWNP